MSYFLWCLVLWINFCGSTVLCRGVPIIGTADISATDILIFPVLVIGTDNQRRRYKCRYSACKINFNKCMPRSTLLQNHVLNYFYQASLCLLQCIQAIPTLTFIESSSTPTNPLPMDYIATRIYGIIYTT